ncbi:MOSC domain-containing protein [Streptomyces sp. NPDC060194]|uniref:MOSC domain-containing protein n=1 Tax=Streptomyces sp. NPDC060194 TaxID=3347069 RepID=UPI00365B01B0
MPLPVLSSLHVHPVKALAGYAPEEAAVEPWGLAGDRRWMVVDEAGSCVTQREHPRLALAAAAPLADGAIALSASGRATLTVRPPALGGPTVPVAVFSDKLEAALADEAAHAWLSAYTGRPVRLVHLDEPAVRRPVTRSGGLPGDTVNLADTYPLLLTTRSSLDALNDLVAAGDHAQEGPLPMDRFRPNLVVDGPPAWAEDDWRRLRIGRVELRVAGPCGRCLVTTTDQRSAKRGKEPLRTLARHRRRDGKLQFGMLLIPATGGTLRRGDGVTILE